ncbi:hypothetical protein C8J56DRAFT_1021201 [Mycena floridula]|nr:hypothetical protein C8J56DRAFT_1021201 [Mycena floridula]
MAQVQTFSRLGFGSKHQSSLRNQSEKDEDWYIQYNGPVEAPRQTRPTQNRDSWGDLVNDGELILADPELHIRYGGQGPDSIWGLERDVEEERKSRPRARTQSGVSGRTVSSGTLDPGRASMRRSTYSSGNDRPPVPSYVNLDSSGGVGESPMPTIKAQSASKRASLASIFNINRKSLFTSSKVTPVDLRTSRIVSTIGNTTSSAPSSPQSGTSLEWNHHPNSQLNRRSHLKGLDSIRDSSEEDEFYHSYYTSLALSPLRNGQLSEPSSRPSERNPDPFKSTQHPYANTFAAESPPTPSSAPITSPSNHLKHTVSKSSLRNNHSSPMRYQYELKNSVSSPDLRNAVRQQKPADIVFPTPRAKPKGKGKDRWLAAETWCDALLFPRPRLKQKDLDGRIVSPPGSPISPDFRGAPSVASRVLAHSRSLVDLAKPKPLDFDPTAALSVPSNSRAPRPKSFALDDLALPSPIPSLSKVLEDGQILDHQRKKWQMQAAGSFQNKRTRSLSRSRTKSLSKQAKQSNETEKLPSIDFLAARSLLGNQKMIAFTKAPVKQTDVKGATMTKVSHSHSTSVSKSTSKSSTWTHSRGHSRSDSLKSAIRIAKGICVVDSALTPPEERLEGALRTEHTKVIRLADPALISVDRGSPSPGSSRPGTSPTPSGISDSRVGIALSTPPLDDNRDHIRMPAHPYAQGGLYTYNDNPDRASEYAGAHPTSPISAPESAKNEVSRHRFPPQASVHPYAQASFRDSYQGEHRIVPQVRVDSDVPAEAKMWAPFSAGLVREVLPHEIQYSPYMSERSSSPAGDDDGIVDTIGVGEALVYGVQKRRSKDSGLGTSEGHASATPAESSGFRVQRKPVQYDVTRPGLKFLSPTLDTIHSVEAHLTPPTSTPEHSNSPSPGDTAQSSDIEQLMENSDDIEHFRDLFYRPSGSVVTMDPITPPIITRTSSFPWDPAQGHGRTGSGLTSLARQLSEELEYASSNDARSSMSTFARRHPLTDSGLHFVVSDKAESTSLVDASGQAAALHDGVPAFRPSPNIPEDVESSRASSIMEPSPLDDPSAFRLGSVETAMTPPIVSGNSRHSYIGQLAFTEANVSRHEPVDDDALRRSRETSTQALSPHSADAARSSYLTSSSLSRMSGLSDFPLPPPPDMSTPAHMSLLSSYFGEIMARNEQRDSNFSDLPPNPRRVTFGKDDDVEELLASLSDHS